MSKHLSTNDVLKPGFWLLYPPSRPPVLIWSHEEITIYPNEDSTGFTFSKAHFRNDAEVILTTLLKQTAPQQRKTQ